MQLDTFHTDSDGKTVLIPTQQHIKQMHLNEIFLIALRTDGISRAELRQELHLSFPSVSALVDELLAAGILYEDGTTVQAERGRPRSMLRVDPEAFWVPVATLSAEGYRLALFDCCSRLQESIFLPFPPEADRSNMDVLSQPLKEQLAVLKKRYHIPELVLTASGNFNSNGALSSSILGFTTPEAFMPQLQQRLGLPVRIYNNADCYAYGEKYCQKLPEDYIVVSVGRGVGAGIVRNGQIFSGGFLRAGEIGHICIDHRGPLCSCGSRGCLERYISTDRITAEACRLLELDPQTTKFETVCSLYKSGDSRLDALIEEKARLLALGISNMLAMQPVSHIVIGGGIDALGDRFLELLRRQIRTTGLRKYMDRITLCRSRNTKNAEALGAFWIYLNHDLCISECKKPQSAAYIPEDGSGS